MISVNYSLISLGGALNGILLGFAEFILLIKVFSFYRVVMIEGTFS
jgi:hypothetical protein